MKQSVRLWYGDEKEGDCRERTLFVQAEHVNALVADMALAAASANGCHRLYFGAGRIDVRRVSKDALNTLRFMGRSLVIETTVKHMRTAVQFDALGATVVLRHEVPQMPRLRHLVLKADNMRKWCAVGVKTVTSDIRGVKRGMYKGDVEVYKS